VAVYRNMGKGFATTPTSWTVPTLDTAEGFYLTSGSSSSGGVDWATMDLNGDGRLDLVQTAENSIVLGPAPRPGASTSASSVLLDALVNAAMNRLLWMAVDALRVDC